MSIVFIFSILRKGIVLHRRRRDAFEMRSMMIVAERWLLGVVDLCYPVQLSFGAPLDGLASNEVVHVLNEIKYVVFDVMYDSDFRWKNSFMRIVAHMRVLDYRGQNLS